MEVYRREGEEWKQFSCKIIKLVLDFYLSIKYVTLQVSALHVTDYFIMTIIQMNKSTTFTDVLKQDQLYPVAKFGDVCQNVPAKGGSLSGCILNSVLKML